jgi:hypothetical protein
LLTHPSDDDLVNNRALGDASCPPLPAIRPPSPVKAFIPIKHTDIKRIIAETVEPVVKSRSSSRRPPQSVSMKTTRSASAAARSPPTAHIQIDPPSSSKKKGAPTNGNGNGNSGRVKRAASTQAMENIQASQSGASDSEEPPVPNKKRRVPAKRAASIGPTSPLAKGFGSDALAIPGATVKTASRSRSRLASPLSVGNTTEGEEEDTSVSPTDTLTYGTRRKRGPGHLKCVFQFSFCTEG